MLRLWLAEEGEDDLDLFWGEEFAFGGVGGSGEFGHQWLIGVEFAGEEATRNFFVIVCEIDFRKVLFEFETLHDV